MTFHSFYHPDRVPGCFWCGGGGDEYLPAREVGDMGPILTGGAVMFAIWSLVGFLAARVDGRHSRLRAWRAQCKAAGALRDKVAPPW